MSQRPSCLFLDACVFYKTNDVFDAEERLLRSGVACSIVPTPVQDKAYCGVCISVDLESSPEAIDALSPLEYIIIKE